MTHQMITPPLPAPPSTGLPDVLTAVATAGWYALPDYIRSRAARGAVKTGILLASAAYGSRVVKRRPPPAQDGRPPAETPHPRRTTCPGGRRLRCGASRSWARRRWPSGPSQR
ncbi:hypothetical protein [Arthrobacter sp. MDT1-65]